MISVRKNIFLFSIMLSACMLNNAKAQSNWPQLDIIKGAVVTNGLMMPSARMPLVHIQDGSFIQLIYKNDSGITITMMKNGKVTRFDKTWPGQYVQVAEQDIDGDKKPEILVAYRDTANHYKIDIFKKPDFQYLYKLWYTLNGKGLVEFPGDGSVRMIEGDSIKVKELTGSGKTN
jgi:hypothetical protein